MAATHTESEPLVGSPRRGRGRSTLLVLGIVLLVLVVIGVLAWRQYTTSPRYALTQLALSAQSGDWEGVQTWMDVDAVSDDIVDAAIEQALADRESEIGQLGLLGEELAAGIAEAMRPRLAEEVREQMREQIQSQDGDARRYFGALYIGNNPEALEVSGDQARAVVELPYRERQVELDLGLQRAGDAWRVVQLNNAAELVEQYGPGN
jgi:hypothetical protein